MDHIKLVLKSSLNKAQNRHLLILAMLHTGDRDEEGKMMSLQGPLPKESMA